MLYFPPLESGARRDPWKLPSMPASEMASQLSPALNSAGNTQPAGDGETVPTGMSIW